LTVSNAFPAQDFIWTRDTSILLIFLVFFIPCDRQLLDQRSIWHSGRTSDLEFQMLSMHGSIFGCIYLLQFKFGNFCRNSAKQATVCPFTVIENTITIQWWIFYFLKWNHFCGKIWFIVTFVWRLLVDLPKIRKIWHCQSHSCPLSK
jgi:hypothetical protein